MEYGSLPGTDTFTRNITMRTNPVALLRLRGKNAGKIVFRNFSNCATFKATDLAMFWYPAKKIARDKHCFFGFSLFISKFVLFQCLPTHYLRYTT